jgi:hypothetical protein
MEAEKLFKNELLIFKIYINSDNKVASTIMLDSGATSAYLFEMEVLLLPFFTFRVIDITQTQEKLVMLEPSKEKVRAKITIVTV